ncbi:MAG: substrate-binding domain-containing protein [Bacteroidales bacterium]
MMRNHLTKLATALIFLCFFGNSFARERLKGQISISGAFALYPMTVRWAEEFRKLHPDVRIDISAGGAGKGITDALSGMVDIGMVSREINAEEFKKGALPIAVTRDAVVAIVSAQNPVINEILARGLSRNAANSIWITGKVKSWGQAFAIKSTLPLHVYTRSDACGAADMWANYFGKKQEDLLGVGVFGDPGLAMAVKKDPLGIGFSNIGYVYDANTRLQIKGIRVFPVDLNGNGKIDPDENFYNSMNDFIAAVATGKYPSPPARELYFVTKGSPKSNILISEFLRWVLTSGQQFVSEAGYIALPKEMIASELRKIK